METRLTGLLGIKYPIILASMAWVTNAEMVAAISNAGALGTLGPNAGASKVTSDVKETGERLRRQIKRVRELTNNPFAVNLVVGAAGLDKEFSERCIQVSMEEEVPVAVVSQGNPAVHTERLKTAGMKVLHVCASVKHAKSAAKAGVDAVVASGTEGGGHSGFDQNTTFCLVPQVVDAVDLPVVAGGGVADGRQLLAALSLGAEGVYVGTRFIATQECPAHDRYKKELLNSKDGDTISIRHGQIGRSGKGDAGFTAERRGSLRMILSEKVKEALAEHVGTPDFETLMKLQTQVPPEKGGSPTAAAFIYGDEENPFWAAGQGVGLISQISPCKEVVQNFIQEAEAAFRRLKSLHPDKTGTQE